MATSCGARRLVNSTWSDIAVRRDRRPAPGAQPQGRRAPPSAGGRKRRTGSRRGDVPSRRVAAWGGRTCSVGKEEDGAPRLRTELEAVHADVDMPREEKLAGAMGTG